MTSPCGIYRVNDKYYQSKLLAVLEASKSNAPVVWDFHDSSFSEANSFPSSGSTLAEMYKTRALQLRESYDYLILNYSGGSDSWTILNTFLTNNIKLDHIVVKWPMSALDKGWYQPNQTDKSAFNFPSEWDFTLKKDIEWLTSKHPEIKIEIVDWLEKLDAEYVNDDLIINLNIHRFYLNNLLRLSGLSKTETNLIDKGKSVAAIYGVDKPRLIEKENHCYFYFSDEAVLASGSEISNINRDGVEFFFWTPDFPSLVVEQARRLYNWYKQHPAMQQLLSTSHVSRERFDLATVYNIVNDQYDIAKMVLYPEWDTTKFQARKPHPGLYGSEKDIWLENQPHVAKIKEGWIHHWNSYSQAISPQFLLPGTGQMRSTGTKWYYLGDF